MEAEITVCNTIMTSSRGEEDENGKMLLQQQPGTPKPGCTACPSDQDIAFKVYPERWWLLLTVVLLNLANYSHWVAFPSVAKNAAKYYDQVMTLLYFSWLRS